MAKRGELLWGICKVQSVLGVSLRRNRSSCTTRFPDDRRGREASATRMASNTMAGGPAYTSNDTLGLRLFSSSSNKPCTKLARPIRASTSTQMSISTWVRWIGGSFLSILISVWTHKYWRNLQMIEGEAEVVLEEVDNAAKMVKKAATMTEKVSADVAEKLPTHSKLKEIALLIERVSKLAAQDAELTHQFIHKVDALKEDLENLEKLLKPAIDEIENYEHQREQLTSPIQTM